MSSAKKPWIDEEKCCGYGLCAEACPEVFEVSAEGMAHVLVDVVDAELIPRVKEAVEACPMGAVSFDDGAA